MDPIIDTTSSPYARLRGVPVSAVRLRDAFWAPRLRANREVTLPSQFRHLEETGRLDNFRRAAGKKGGEFQGIFFNDSDVYKWLEAASWELASGRSADLESMVDAAIAEVAAAQQPDGYLNTYFMFDRAKDRWTNLKDMHELYCAGHLIQAAVAHHRETGNTTLLDVARRFADHIRVTFGTPSADAPGRREGTCGHEEIEMALVELARETGDRGCLDQAVYFLGARGRGLIGGGAYHQDHLPVREQDRMTGHAVRHVYLCCGMADAYADTGDAALLSALKRLWANMTEMQLYVTGGVGSRHEGEAFGRDYELPNERAYAETCAAIGSVMWSWRMLQLDGDARYADLIEHTLYNGVLPGISLDGQTYFYENPLADDGTHRRQPWFGCACCPPNVARLLASLPGYFYGVSEDTVWVHLYGAGEAALALPDGRTVRVEQETAYPWDGAVTLRVHGDGEFDVNIRVPGWCADAAIDADGATVTEVRPGTYTRVRRDWTGGATIRLQLAMPLRMLECHPHAAENRGCVALMRGPLVYCLEEADNPGIDLRDARIPRQSEWVWDRGPESLGDARVLRGEGIVEAPDPGWSGRLYRTAAAPSGAPRPVQLTAIPYYAWANREPGRMQVWTAAAD